MLRRSPSPPRDGKSAEGRSLQPIPKRRRLAGDRKVIQRRAYRRAIVIMNPNIERKAAPPDAQRGAGERTFPLIGRIPRPEIAAANAVQRKKQSEQQKEGRGPHEKGVDAAKHRGRIVPLAMIANEPLF